MQLTSPVVGVVGVRMRVVWIQEVILLYKVCLLLSLVTIVDATERASFKRERLSGHSSTVRLTSQKETEPKLSAYTEIKMTMSINRNFEPLIQDHRIVKRNEPTKNISKTFSAPFYDLGCEPERSCSGRCIYNRTEWRTRVKLTCSCDPDCYEVFNDCCADYEKYCGFQKPTNVLTKKYNWTCEKVGYYDSKYCAVADGVWMVSRCANGWPDDNTRTKCETPLTKLTISLLDLTRFLPVVGQDNVTFRNLHCALCNKVTDLYGQWPLNIETTVIPPESYNFSQKIQFLLSHGAIFPDKGLLHPKPSHPRRYCVEQMVDSCPSKNKSFTCTTSQTAAVTAGRNYKNIHCAFCHGLWRDALSCFPAGFGKTCESFFPQSFSLVLDYRTNNGNSAENSKFSVKKEECAKQGMVFDDILQVCLFNSLGPPVQNKKDRFYVAAWLAPQEWSKSNGFLPREFKKSFIEYFNVSRTQILHINISTIPKQDVLSAVPVVSFFLVSSTVILTPQQSLELSSTNRNFYKAFKPNLLSFIYFKEPLTMNIRNSNYTIIKTTSRPLSCVGRKLYTPKEYSLLDEERVYINSTNITYGKSQYFRENSERSILGNITVCEKYFPIGCNITWTRLAPMQFTKMINSSIYHNETGIVYHYGQYAMLSNGSAVVCISIHTKPTNNYPLIWDDIVLVSLACIGSILSMMFLIFLLVTYILFSQLRTLPGKNLMNLAVTMLMSNLFWILPVFRSVRSNESLCTAIAVMEHYFSLTHFVSMSVIAFHTCKVFVRQMPAPKLSHNYEQKLFKLYFFLVWIIPAIFVITCFTLDKKDTLLLGYGNPKTCWLRENEAYDYFVTVPVSLLLLFNIVAFTTSIIYLRKHGQNSIVKQTSGVRRTNLSIYIKLSTLMGFTWLFAFLDQYLDSTVFWYLFVISTSLQGVFVTVAFVINTKTLKMYGRLSGKRQKNSMPKIPTGNHRDNIVEESKM